VLVADLPGARAHRYPAEDPELGLDPAPLEVAAVADAVGYRVTVTARSLAKDVTLQPDRVHPTAEADHGLVTLLPGESAEFVVTAPAGLDLAAFADALVVRSANDLVY